MSHDPHDAERPDCLLHDQCGECALRAASLDLAIGHMDPLRFAQAWLRAAAHGRDELPYVSSAEVPLLRALFAVECQLDRLGLPVGRLPAAMCGACASGHCGRARCVTGGGCGCPCSTWARADAADSATARQEVPGGELS